MAALKKKTVQYVLTTWSTPKITHLVVISLAMLVISAELLIAVASVK